MKKVNSHICIAVILLISAIFISCTKEKKEEGTNNDPETIQITSSGYSKTSLQVFAGTTVTWVNNDNAVHTVTASDAKFDSGDMAPGSSFSYTFNTAGTFSYYCKHHANMTGTVVVLLVK